MNSRDPHLSDSQLRTSEWELLGWLLLQKPFSLREVASNAEVGVVRTNQSAVSVFFMPVLSCAAWQPACHHCHLAFII